AWLYAWAAGGLESTIKDASVSTPAIALLIFRSLMLVVFNNLVSSSCMTTQSGNTCANGAGRPQPPALRRAHGDLDASVEVDAVGEEAIAQRRTVHPERSDVGAAARPGTDDDLVGGGAVDVADGDAHAASEGGVEGHEAEPELLAGGRERADVGAAAGTGPGDDVLAAGVVDVARGHVDASGEGGVVGVEARVEHAAGGAEHLHQGAATSAGAGDDLVAGHAVHLARRHVDAAVGARVVGEELMQRLALGRAAEHPHVGAATRSCARDDLGLAGVNRAHGHVDAAAEPGRVGEELVEQLPAVAEHAHDRERARARAHDDLGAGVTGDDVATRH